MTFFKALRDCLRLMVGVPNYERYVAHRRERHPNLPVMSYEEFFRERQSKRFERGQGKCC